MPPAQVSDPDVDGKLEPFPRCSQFCLPVDRDESSVVSNPCPEVEMNHEEDDDQVERLINEGS